MKCDSSHMCVTTRFSIYSLYAQPSNTQYLVRLTKNRVSACTQWTKQALMHHAPRHICSNVYPPVSLCTASNCSLLDTAVNHHGGPPLRHQVLIPGRQRHRLPRPSHVHPVNLQRRAATWLPASRAGTTVSTSARSRRQSKGDRAHLRALLGPAEAAR